MMLQLDPMIPVDTPKGEGYACGWIDYSQEHHLIWVVLLDSGECWQFENQEIRVIANRTLNRGKPDECKTACIWQMMGTKGTEAELKDRGLIP